MGRLKWPRGTGFAGGGGTCLPAEEAAEKARGASFEAVTFVARDISDEGAVRHRMRNMQLTFYQEALPGGLAMMQGSRVSAPVPPARFFGLRLFGNRLSSQEEESPNDMLL